MKLVLPFVIFGQTYFCVFKHWSYNTDNTYKKTNNNRLPRIAVPFERHPYSWLFTRNCSSREGLRKPITYPRNTWHSNGTAIHGNDGSCSSVVQRSHDSDCSDKNLPSFFLVSHRRTAWTCAYSLLFRSHASSFTIARTHSTYVLAAMWQLLPHPPFNHTLRHTCWKAGHCVSSLVELFGPW